MKISSKTWVTVAASLVGCATLVVPGTASAWSCAGTEFLAPRNGATGVPTNSLIWAQGRFDGTERARLFGPGGEVPTAERYVPVSIGAAQGASSCHRAQASRP